MGPFRKSSKLIILLVIPKHQNPIDKPKSSVLALCSFDSSSQRLSSKKYDRHHKKILREPYRIDAAEQATKNLCRSLPIHQPPVCSSSKQIAILRSTLFWLRNYFRISSLSIDSSTYFQSCLMNDFITLVFIYLFQSLSIYLFI